MRILTKSGFECDVRENALEDYRTVKLIAKAEKGNEGEMLVAITELISRVLGEEQEEELLAYLEENSGDGVATFEDVHDAFMEVMEALKDSKKNT